MRARGTARGRSGAVAAAASGRTAGRVGRAPPAVVCAAALLLAPALPATVAGAQDPADTAAAPAPTSPAILGDWQGTLQVPMQELRIIFHIVEGDDGEPAATLDSPDQGAFGIAAGAVETAGDTVRIPVPVIQGRYEGVLREDDAVLDGTWEQGGLEFPLELERMASDAAADAASGPPRPQHPEPPFPYAAEEVTVSNADAGVELAGTFTVPAGDGPFPAVALISGSGPQDRDETIFGHKPFLVLADHLTRRGVAVLRYDDRGVGGSTGEFRAATTRDFADDALAAVRWLRARPEVDAERVGLIGHSEGGLVAPITAVESDGDVAFAVLLAAPGVPLDSVIHLQSAAIARANGADEDAIARDRELLGHLFRILDQEPDDDAAAERMRAALREALAELSPDEAAALGADTANREQYIEQQVRQLTGPWFRFALRHDPRPVLERLGIPVLALTGEKDLQVPPSANLPEIRAALDAGGNDRHTVEELPALNHLFQHAETGAPREYGRIEETFAPSALERIADWILGTAGGRR